MARQTFYISYSPDRWYNIGGGVLGVGCWTGRYIRNLSLLPFWVTPPCKLQGANQKIWHGSLFTAATGNGHISQCITLAMLYSAWAVGMEDISEIFHFYPLGYPLRQRFWELGGPTHPKFGMVVDLSSVLDKFVFVFR